MAMVAGPAAHPSTIRRHDPSRFVPRPTLHRGPPCLRQVRDTARRGREQEWDHRRRDLFAAIRGPLTRYESHRLRDGYVVPYDQRTVGDQHQDWREAGARRDRDRTVMVARRKAARVPFARE